MARPALRGSSISSGVAPTGVPAIRTSAAGGSETTWILIVADPGRAWAASVGFEAWAGARGGAAGSRGDGAGAAARGGATLAGGAAAGGDGSSPLAIVITSMAMMPTSAMPQAM